MKHFVTVSLDELQAMKFTAKVNVLLIAVMQNFKHALDIMYPDETNIGYKLDAINKNLFVNDFLYQILDSTKEIESKLIMSEYFNLKDN